jgi:hypothetical protein
VHCHRNRRSLLARVQRLEDAGRAPRSPFEVGWGTVGAWADEVQAGIDAGAYDPIDMPHVVACIRKWHADGLWLGLRWVPVRDHGQ